MANYKGLDLSKFTDKQIAAIEILSQPKRGGLTYEQVADTVGVNRCTLLEWRRNDDFIQAVTKRAIMNLHADLPEVFAANMTRAKAGEVRSVELMYKLLELLVDKAEVIVEEKDGSNETVADDIKRLKEMLGKG